MKVVYYVSKQDALTARQLLANIRAYGVGAYMRSAHGFNFAGNDIEVDADLILTDGDERGEAVINAYRAVEGKAKRAGSNAPVEFSWAVAPQGIGPAEIAQWCADNFTPKPPQVEPEPDAVAEKVPAPDAPKGKRK